MTCLCLFPPSRCWRLVISHTPRQKEGKHFSGALTEELQSPSRNHAPFKVGCICSTLSHSLPDSSHSAREHKLAVYQSSPGCPSRLGQTAQMQHIVRKQTYPSNFLHCSLCLKFFHCFDENCLLNLLPLSSLLIIE